MKSLPVIPADHNPGGFWWGMVLTSAGWRHVQEVGRVAAEKKMRKLGATD